MINKIKAELIRNKLDGVVITSKTNRRYFSGFTGSDGIVLITENEAYLFVDGRYTTQAEQQATGFKVIKFTASPYDLIAEFKIKNLGFEGDSILFSTYNKLKQAMPDADFRDFSFVLENMRMVKNDGERLKIKQAAKIADDAFAHIIKKIKVGASERDIAIELEFFMRKSGAEGVSFDLIVASGIRSALPHGGPSDKKIEYGDMVLMDFGCIFDGYCSDMTRTVAVGEISKEKEKIYNVVLIAQKAALACIKAGVECQNADKTARDIICSFDYGEYFSHSLGHGVGLEIHEEPRLSTRSEQILQKNMMVTVEPGVYIPNLCGVRIEDLVCITDDGYENFTKSEKELIII